MTSREEAEINLGTKNIEQCCECNEYFIFDEMIRVSQFNLPHKHGDWCCEPCAREIEENLREQLKQRYYERNKESIDSMKNDPWY